MDADNSLPLPPPANTDMSMNITENITLIDDGPRLCPLCNSIVKLFFINFNQKILMCENTRCEFPFGYENLQFFKVDTEMETDTELASLPSRPTHASQFSGSIVSAAEWMDIERLNNICDSEDIQSLSYSKSKRKNLDQLKKAKESEQDIKENLDKIKELNQILYEDEHRDHNNIRNKGWIQNLYKIQENFGVQLLNNRELEKLKSKKPKIGKGELKIDINAQDSLSSIKIELVNQSDAT